MEVNFMQTQVKAWGNSQGIRLPKDILQEANVEINDMLEVKVSDGMIMLVKTFRHQKLEERAENGENGDTAGRCFKSGKN